MSDDESLKDGGVVQEPTLESLAAERQALVARAEVIRAIPKAERSADDTEQFRQIQAAFAALTAKETALKAKVVVPSRVDPTQDLAKLRERAIDEAQAEMKRKHAALRDVAVSIAQAVGVTDIAALDVDVVRVALLDRSVPEAQINALLPKLVFAKVTLGTYSSDSRDMDVLIRKSEEFDEYMEPLKELQSLLARPVSKRPESLNASDNVTIIAPGEPGGPAAGAKTIKEGISPPDEAGAGGGRGSAPTDRLASLNMQRGGGASTQQLPPEPKRQNAGQPPGDGGGKPRRKKGSGSPGGGSQGQGAPRPPSSAQSQGPRQVPPQAPRPPKRSLWDRTRIGDVVGGAIRNTVQPGIDALRVKLDARSQRRKAERAVRRASNERIRQEANQRSLEQKRLARAANGEGRLNEEEKAALERAVGKTIGGQQFTRDDLFEFYAKRGGWTGDIAPQLRHRISRKEEDRLFFLRIREILKPVWDAEARQARKESLDQLKEQGKWIGKRVPGIRRFIEEEETPKQRAADMELGKQRLSPAAWRALNANRRTQDMSNDEQLYLYILGRKKNRGVPVSNVERDAFRRVTARIPTP